MKTPSYKNYLFLSLFIFSISADTQQIDPDLLMGLSDSDISLAKDFLNSDSVGELIEENPDAQEIKETLEKVNDNSMAKDVDAEGEIILKKFGYDFFSSMPTSVSAIGDLPLPGDYKISIKDQFSVILSGNKTSIFDLNVKLDGTILFPEIGSISVIGETLDEVKEKISNIVEQTFIGVQVDISLKSLSAKKISIVGAVNIPGTYLVNPFSTITGALAYSGGVTEVGSLRNITLKRANGNTYTFDLYDLLIKGDRSKDLIIESGDTILINPAEQFVRLEGSIRRPGLYEILESDRLGSLISYGLGLEKDANKSKILLSKNNDDFTSNFQIETSDMEITLENVFSVNIFSYLPTNKNKILVSGAVYEAGLYAEDEFTNLEDLINALTFVEVYPWLAFLETLDSKKASKEITIFSLKDQSTYESVSLNGDSRIHFFNLRNPDFFLMDADVQTIRKINEYMLKINYGDEEFRYPVIGDFSPIEVLNFIGLNKDDYMEEVAYIKPIEDEIVLGKINSLSVKATKFNTVQLRKPLDNIIEVFILGEINYPGKYSLKSGSTLTDLYALAGGFKEQAFFNGIIFQRDSVKERQIEAIKRSNMQINELLKLDLAKNENVNADLFSILSSEIDEENLGRIGGNFAPGSALSNEILLNDGDSIFVPKFTNIISVVGEVTNPTSFVSSSELSVADVINRGGGFKSMADKRSTYIISADGSISRSSRNIFSGNSKLYPGDTLVVPRKINQSGIAETITPITQILSNLAFSAAAIDNLKNN